MKYHIITLGCKVNQYESEVMAELLDQAGYTKADNYTESDICIVNSCTVTATADAKNRKYIHRIRRENPNSIIILCGCMPQAAGADDLNKSNPSDLKPEDKKPEDPKPEYNGEKAAFDFLKGIIERNNKGD